MKENIDILIKKKIHQEQIKVPESYFKKIGMTLQGLPEERIKNTQGTKKLRYRHIVAAAAGFCLLISGTAYATVNYVQERMLSINENDKKEMADYKIDYSFMTSKEDVSSDKPAVDNVVGEDGIEQMKTMISIIYQVDTDNMEASLETDINGVYRIEINDSELGIYRALYDLDAERIVEIEYTSSIDIVSGKIEPDNEHFTEVGEKLTQTILRLDSNIAIKEIYCDYNITEDKLLARGIVNYIYKLEDGECYVVKYNTELDNVTNLFIIPYDAYQQIIDNNAVKQEKMGIERIRISIDVK